MRGRRDKEVIYTEGDFMDVMKNIDIGPAVRIIPSVAVHDTN